MVASYHSPNLKFSELFRMTHSFTNACKGRLHGWVHDFGGDVTQ